MKDHFYHPVDENILWLTAIREAVGDEIDCMHDPVAIYTYEEAVKVGRALEELEYRWFEEPLPERSHNLAGAVGIRRSIFRSWRRRRSCTIQICVLNT